MRDSCQHSAKLLAMRVVVLAALSGNVFPSILLSFDLSGSLDR